MLFVAGGGLLLLLVSTLRLFIQDHTATNPTESETWFHPQRKPAQPANQRRENPKKKPSHL